MDLLPNATLTDALSPTGESKRARREEEDHEEGEKVRNNGLEAEGRKRARNETSSRVLCEFMHPQIDAWDWNLIDLKEFSKSLERS